MDKNCSGCGQQDRCQEVYHKLGQSKGPNIAVKAIQAFVLPIAVFVIAAGAALPWLKQKIDNPKLLIVAQLGIGLVAAALLVWVMKLLDRPKNPGTKECPNKDTL